MNDSKNRKAIKSFKKIKLSKEEKELILKNIMFDSRKIKKKEIPMGNFEIITFPVE
jgi:hypothetical protein